MSFVSMQRKPPVLTVLRVHKMLNMRFQPGLHCQAAFLAHWKGILPFHGAFFITERSVPELGNYGTCLHIHLFGCFFDDLRLDSETKALTRAGKRIVHGKGVQSGNI